MAAKKEIEIQKPNAPQTIDRNLGFFRKFPYKLTDEQIAFCKAIYNPKNIGVFCNARAGSSKTTLAVGMGLYMTLVTKSKKQEFLTVRLEAYDFSRGRFTMIEKKHLCSVSFLFHFWKRVVFNHILYH